MSDSLKPVPALGPLPTATPLRPRKRAILVGASSGLGAALARRLAGEGYLLALLARRDDLLEALCREINQRHSEVRALSYKHDVSGDAGVEDLLRTIIADLGGLDLFIYLAGVNLPPGPDQLNYEQDRRMMEVNVLGAMAWLTPVSALFKSMHGGHIIGISSVAGDRGRVGNPGYNTSKAALSTYLEALRNRLTRHGVHILTVKPGFIKTDMLRAAQGATPFAIEPERAAADIWDALQKRKQTVYTPGLWRWIMLAIQHIPSVIFRRMSF
ncbi:MAG: SDR family NAD(P)-dependent oxidoreductase [Bacteroidota bacterium]